MFSSLVCELFVAKNPHLGRVIFHQCIHIVLVKVMRMMTMMMYRFRISLEV